MKSQSQTIFSFCPTAEVESISGFLIEPSNNLIKLYLVSLQNLVKWSIFKVIKFAVKELG